MEPSQSLLNIPVLEAPSAPTRSPQPRNIEPMITPTQRLREDPLTIPLAPPPPPIQPQPQPFPRRLRRRKPLIFPDTQLPPPQPQPQSHNSTPSTTPVSSPPQQQYTIITPPQTQPQQSLYIPPDPTKYSPMAIPKSSTLSELLKSIPSTPQTSRKYLPPSTPQTSRASLYSRPKPQPFDPSPQGFTLPPFDPSTSPKLPMPTPSTATNQPEYPVPQEFFVPTSSQVKSRKPSKLAASFSAPAAPPPVLKRTTPREQKIHTEYERVGKCLIWVILH